VRPRPFLIGQRISIG